MKATQAPSLPLRAAVPDVRADGAGLHAARARSPHGR